MGGFRELNVWQEAKKLAVEIYRLTNGGAFSKDFGMRDQIRRSAVSIPSNIAKGDERGSNKDAIRFLYIAKGSLAELQTQLDISLDVGYIDPLTLETLNAQCDRIAKMLGSLIKARSKTLNP